jgi:Cu/Ag efflux protein CusF/plastocyanin
MKRTFLIGISVVALVGAVASPAWAFTETRTAFVPEDPLEQHRIVATSCEQPRGFRRINMKGGIKFAREGETFAFEPRVIRAKRCEEVEIVLENTDSVRHAFMLPGLNPMFTLEFTGPQTRSLRFVTPDEDVTLEFHCHVPLHEKMGMHGLLIVGTGGRPVAEKTVVQQEKRLYEGVGVVVAADIRTSRMVIDHEEIKDFMAPMEMSYLVSPATLLRGLEPGDKVRFVIDADKRTIVDIGSMAK